MTTGYNCWLVSFMLTQLEKYIRDSKIIDFEPAWDPTARESHLPPTCVEKLEKW